MACGRLMAMALHSASVWPFPAYKISQVNSERRHGRASRRRLRLLQHGFHPRDSSQPERDSRVLCGFSHGHILDTEVMFDHVDALCGMRAKNAIQADH
jgi:hypothetical protein